MKPMHAVKCTHSPATIINSTGKSEFAHQNLENYGNTFCDCTAYGIYHAVICFKYTERIGCVEKRVLRRKKGLLKDTLSIIARWSRIFWAKSLASGRPSPQGLVTQSLYTYVSIMY